MKITCIGAGPAGLSFAIRAKLVRPDFAITMFERGRARETSGWGLILSEGVLAALEADDETVGRRLRARMLAWSDIRVEVSGRSTSVRGHEFLSVARVDLVSILRERAEEIGINIRYDAIVDPMSEKIVSADLLVLADGSQSAMRNADPATFGVRLREGRNVYLWLGVRKMLGPFFRFAFETTAAGPIWVHSYPFSEDFTTFVIECPQTTWRGLGFDEANLDDTLSRCEAIFASCLKGERLLASDTRRAAVKWSRFADVSCDRWRSGKTVLLGNAAHGTHFSIGSGTRLALDDGRELAQRVVAMRGRDFAAIDAYEAARKTGSEKLHRAAGRSRAWFEKPPIDLGTSDIDAFAYSLVSRSGRIGRTELAELDPAFLARVEQSGAATRIPFLAE